MDGRQAIGIALIMLGLVLFVSAILGRTGKTFSALIYGEGG